MIDRIPFPRPDDPLMSARQRAADQAGGNGFMQVAATHAALLLAQGAGRLIRTTSDRGVVAVLDPRLATARYGGFLKASLPPMWTTTDPAVVRKALARLVGAQAPTWRRVSAPTCRCATAPRPSRVVRSAPTCRLLTRTSQDAGRRADLSSSTQVGQTPPSLFTQVGGRPFVPEASAHPSCRHQRHVAARARSRDGSRAGGVDSRPRST